MHSFRKISQPRSPLASRLLRVVLSTYLCVALLVTAFQLVLEYRDEERRLQVEVDQIAAAFLPVLTTALWNLDEDQTNTTADGIWANPALWRMTVTDDLDQQVVLRNRQHSPLVERWQLPWYEYEYEILHIDDASAAQRIGVMTLASNALVVASRATSTFAYTIVNAAVKTLVLWLIFYYALVRIIANPLSALARAAHRINPDTSEAAALPEPSLTELHTDDELGSLAVSFSELEASLAEKNRLINDRQRKLEKMVQELEGALNAKSTFLAHMSHELRTPMNGMLGMVTLLSDSPLNAQQASYVATLANSGTQLLAVINNVLDFSRNQSGRQELEVVEFDLERLAHDCVDTFYASALEKNLELALEAEIGDRAHVLGDPVKIRQIVSNLLGNAIKFTDAGRVVLRLNCEDRGEGWMLSASVSDNGIGLSAEQKARLFEPFSQGDQSTSRQYGGTGLGLAICRQLVELMGGAISVESQPGRGSTFSFTVPLQKPQPSALAAFSTPEPEAAAAPVAQYPALNVLVAEDNPVNQLVVKSFLRKFGIEPEIRNNGAEAVEQCRAKRDHYDLVFMDIEMPMLDGWAATRLLREDAALRPNGAPLMIVGLSAHALSIERQKAEEHGMDGYLAKPVSLEDIEQMLARASGIDSAPG